MLFTALTKTHWLCGQSKMLWQRTKYSTAMVNITIFYTPTLHPHYLVHVARLLSVLAGHLVCDLFLNCFTDIKGNKSIIFSAPKMTDSVYI